MTQVISVQKLHELMGKGLPKEACILDVRTLQEVQAGQIEGALHIPLAMLPFESGELEPYTTLYVYCRSGGRSGQAVEWLQNHELDAHNVEGGILAWKAAGFELV